MLKDRVSWECKALTKSILFGTSSGSEQRNQGGDFILVVFAAKIASYEIGWGY